MKENYFNYIDIAIYADWALLRSIVYWRKGNRKAQLLHSTENFKNSVFFSSPCRLGLEVHPTIFHSVFSQLTFLLYWIQQQQRYTFKRNEFLRITIWMNSWRFFFLHPPINDMLIKRLDRKTLFFSKSLGFLWITSSYFAFCCSDFWFSVILRLRTCFSFWFWHCLPLQWRKIGVTRRINVEPFLLLATEILVITSWQKRMTKVAHRIYIAMMILSSFINVANCTE